jgi:hypothetical protein
VRARLRIAGAAFVAALAAVGCGLGVSGGAGAAAPADASSDAPGAMDARDARPPGDGPTTLEAGCGDVGTDPQNCGACGHSCLGGACTTGACQPSMLASGMQGVCAIAVAGSLLYYAVNDSGEIGKLDLASGAVTSLVSTGDAPNDIAVASDRVFWTDTVGVGYFLLSNPSQPATQGLSGGARAIALTSTSEYVITPGALYDFDRTLGINAQASISGGQATVAVDANYAYWVSGAIFRATLGYAMGSLLVSGESPAMIAVDGTGIYWSDFNVVGHAALDGSSSGPLTQNEGEAVSVAIDGSFVYWADRMNSTIRRIPKGGGAPTTLVANVAQASQPAMPRLLAFDATAIYFASSGGGKISRLAK